MNGRALEEEMDAATSAVRLEHIRHLESLGVPLRSIAAIGEHLPPFGVTNVRWLPDGLYEPDPDGDLAIIIPVPAAERELGELGLIDLIACSTDDPSRWAWRVGTGWLLGEWLLDDEEVAVVQTPIGWLAQAGAAAVILDWDAPASCWSALREVTSLRFDSETIKGRAAEAMLRSVSMPQMTVRNAA
jgi:hypothetical protein